MLEQFCLEYYGSAPSIPPQILVPRGAGRHERARGVPLRAARLARRGARAGARREAAAAGARAAERRARARRRRRSSPRRSGCAASRRSRSCARRSTSRRCRSGSSASTSRTSRARRSSARWSSSRTRSRRRRTTASSRVRGVRGPGRLRGDGARWSRAASRGSPRTPASEEWDESFAATPNLVVIDGGKGQLSAALAAMQALRPAARRGDRAREADRGGVRPRAGPTRSCSPSTRRACSCCSGSATRRTASRSPSTASAATPPRASRCSTSSRASARRGGARCCSHFGSAERVARGDARRSWRACRACPPKTARTIYAQLHRTGAHRRREDGLPCPARAPPRPRSRSRSCSPAAARRSTSRRAPRRPPPVAAKPPGPGQTLYAGGDWAVVLDGDDATAFHRVGGTWKPDRSRRGEGPRCSARTGRAPTIRPARGRALGSEAARRVGACGSTASSCS